MKPSGEGRRVHPRARLRTAAVLSRLIAVLGAQVGAKSVERDRAGMAKHNFVTTPIVYRGPYIYTTKSEAVGPRRPRREPSPASAARRFVELR